MTSSRVRKAEAAAAQAERDAVLIDAGYPTCRVLNEAEVELVSEINKKGAELSELCAKLRDSNGYEARWGPSAWISCRLA